MNTSTKDDASKAFFEKRYGHWKLEDQAELETRMTADPGFAKAYEAIERSWGALGAHAEAPEIVSFREAALADIRRTGRRRWALPQKGRGWWWAAGVAGLTLALAVAWQVFPYGLRPGQYATRVGELRMLELADRSRIALDSASRLKVRYTGDARLIELLEGQAQFAVAPDPARPFKVQAGDRTIVALGTVFTVEYVDRNLNVALLEGRLAVLPPPSNDDFSRETSGAWRSPSSGQAIELDAGEALEVRRDGRTVVVPKADIEAATAWREGKVILRTETLDEAVRKMNRYSRVKLEIRDAALAREQISGVFEAGNSQGFIEDVKKILPIDARFVDSKTIELRRR